jgi:hypothetical protein
MGEREGLHTGLFWTDLKEGDHLEDQGVGERIILKWSSRSGSGAWTRLIWLRTARSGVLL